MSVKGQSQMQKKNAKFHFTPIFCGLEKSICYPFDFHKILQTCSKIYTLTVPIGYFIVLGPRTKYYKLIFRNLYIGR